MQLSAITGISESTFGSVRAELADSSADEDVDAGRHVMTCLGM